MVCPSHFTTKNSLTESEEQLLLNKVASGDRVFFWQLWELHRDYLLDRCRTWMGGNFDDAEEALSLAALKAWDKLPSYAPNVTNLKGWLNRLTHNLCIDIYRQRQRAPVSTDSVDDEQLSIQETGTSSHPESVLLQQELRIYLRSCIMALSPRLRHPLILHYFQGMSYKEVAQELSTSPDNVSKCLQRARGILRRSLCQYASGLNANAIDANAINEEQCQVLEKEDFQIPIDVDSSIEKIDYRVALLCLETLPPVWYNSHYAQDWI